MPAGIRPLDRLSRVPPHIPRVDVAIAAGLFAWALLEAVLADGPGSTALRGVLAAGFTLPLILRRSQPLVALVVIAAVAILRGALSGPDEIGAMPFPALLLASFSAALYARPRWLTYAAAPVPIVAMPLAGFGTVDWVPLFFLSLTAWVAGWVVRRRAEQLAQARAQAPELAREAVAGERARIARELHDVVAHSVSVISVQAGAAEQLLDHQPQHARGHLEAVRRSAHEALVELRRLVGVLREDEASYAPQPGLERLDELIAETRAAGVPIELREEGTRGRLAPGVELTAYRIAQESLTNVRRHAGTAPTKISIRYQPDALDLEIANQPGHPDATTPPGSGHGLIGMRERVRLFGGTLHAGPAPDGGFTVHAHLPLDAPPAHADPSTASEPSDPLVQVWSATSRCAAALRSAICSRDPEIESSSSARSPDGRSALRPDEADHGLSTRTPGRRASRFAIALPCVLTAARGPRSRTGTVAESPKLPPIRTRARADSESETGSTLRCAVLHAVGRDPRA